MSTASSEIVSTTAVPDAASDDFLEASAQRRMRARTIQAHDIHQQAALALEMLECTYDVKQEHNRLKFLTKTALLGGEDSAEARAERAEAKVAALMEKVAELNATVGELKGENKVLREDRERLFRIVEARPKQ